MKIDFEEFLKEIHARDYTGPNDDMPESFDKWLGDLETEIWIDYANQFGQKQFDLGLEAQKEEEDFSGACGTNER